MYLCFIGSVHLTDFFIVKICEKTKPFDHMFKFAFWFSSTAWKVASKHSSVVLSFMYCIVLSIMMLFSNGEYGCMML